MSALPWQAQAMGTQIMSQRMSWLQETCWILPKAVYKCQRMHSISISRACVGVHLDTSTNLSPTSIS